LDEEYARCLSTMRTARSGNSGVNLLVFIVAASSQELAPAPNPGPNNEIH
jgi:hypothetical protein